MNWWRRFKAWVSGLAAPDPFDVDFPDGTQPLSDADRAAVLAPPTVPIPVPASHRD